MRRKKPLHFLVLALIVVQPLLDVTSYWLNASGTENTMTLLLRLGLLLFTVVLGFCLAEKRRAYYITTAVLLALTAGHVLACVQFGYAQPIRDLNQSGADLSDAPDRAELLHPCSGGFPSFGTRFPARMLCACC